MKVSNILGLIGGIKNKRTQEYKKIITDSMNQMVGKDSKEVMQKGVQNLSPEESETFSQLINNKKRTSEENLQLKNLELKVFDQLNYEGNTHSISEIVAPDGEINEKAFEDICQELITKTPGLTDLANIESKNSRHIAAGTVKAIDHSKAVAHSMQAFGITPEYTKQEAVMAALGHDIGKMISTGEFIHGPLGAKLLKQMFPDISENVLESVSRHMERHLTKDNSLTKILHVADLANGVTDLNKVKEMYPKLQIPANTKYIPIVKSVSRDKNTGQLKETIERFETTGRHEGVIPRNTIAGAQYEYITDPTNTYREFKYFNDKGEPLITLKDGTRLPYMEAVQNNRVAYEHSPIMKASQELEQTKHLAGIPVYEGILISNRAKQILRSKEGKVIKNYIDLDGGINNLYTKEIRQGNPSTTEAAHVLYNLKWAATHPEELSQLQVLGGKTAGKSSVAGFNRLSPGQISLMVDLYRDEGYRGMLTPTIKGSDNLVSRNTHGYTPGGPMSASSKIWTTNSPIVALRFSDVRVLRNKETWEQLIEGLNQKEAKRATELRDDILKFCKKYNIKQGSTKKNKNGKDYPVCGSVEDLLPEVYQLPDKTLAQVMNKYDELQHILGNHHLGIGGPRRGVVTVNPKSLITNNYQNRSYRAHTIKDAPITEFYNQTHNHNGIADFVDQHKFQQLITANIGESLKAALEAGAPYGADFVIPAKDFRVSKWNKGGQIIYFKN